MITLYGSSQSRSFRTLWALEEAELSYEYTKIKIGSQDKNGSQTVQYKTINHQGKVPTLVDDELIITESAAILNYIAMLAPDKKLIPINDVKLRASYDDISFFVLADLEQPLWTYGKHSFVLPKELRLPEIKKTTEYEFARSIDALQHYLENKDYAINNRFTMADILIAHTLHWAGSAQFTVPDNLRNYAQRMYQRPACQQALLKAF
ncbi:MAG: glutathione S-transferase family protein [Pseudomonadota bacterium]|nr:glutathione S-transferase family protein [Pseudomonadota bacterium]